VADQVMIIAAEASSALYAQRLLQYWKANGTPVHAFGVGNREMEILGFEILGRSEEMAVVGLQEVISHWGLIRSTFHRLVDEAARRKPKFVLLMDYPEFNLRLATKLKALGIPVVYYISPQVWAWRTGRVKHIRKVVDRMLVLFPFEKDFYEKHGVKADFVGHPLLDEMSPELLDEKTRLERRARFSLNEGDLVLGLMPGSRHSELNHHLDVQLEAAALLVKRFPNVRPLLMIAPTLERKDVEASLAKAADQYSMSVQVIKDEPMKMIQLTDVILVASGTATLMVGLMEKPMVIMYRVSRITAFLVKLITWNTRFFGMVNLIMDEEVSKELFQDKASAEGLADEVGRLLASRDERLRAQEKLRDLKNRLGSRGATERVAEILSGYLKQ
jgi:lipid-A-disaccharide synthase